MLLIIGLDGATWDLIEPGIAAGRLPHLARLRQRGLWGPLAATMPAATLPSWSTLMTGVNPGRHGIFDFTRRRFGTYAVEFVNASFRKAPSVWRRLSEAGRRVCVLGLPGTYPPEEINGCMVSGFDTPVTTRADASFVWPRALAPLVMGLGGFPFADFQEFRVDRAWYRVALEALRRGIETKTRLATTLLRREPWDCFFLVFGESDTVAHHFWKFHDPRSPRFDAAGAAEFGSAIERVYGWLDVAVGRLCAAAPDDTTVLVVSDHGFGGAGATVVHLNQWLRLQGFQRAHGRAATGRAAAALKRLALRRVPPGWQAWSFRIGGGRWAGRLESRARFAGIDWKHTRAFSEELNYFPSVWLNLKGREPEGTVDRADYERVRDDICAALGALRDPEHGGAVVCRAWRREELYDGPWVDYAPDIVLDFSLDQGYSYVCLPTSMAPGRAAVRRPDAGEWADGKLAGLSGSHRPQGVFVLTPREETDSTQLTDIRIADMAPTILSRCGVGVPENLDGRALTAGTAAWRPPAGAAGAPAEYRYSLAEERELTRRLRRMGYLS